MPAIRARQGCERAEFLVDYEAGDYGIVVLWASEQVAETASSVIGPMLSQALAQAKATGETRHLFDVYEPKK